MRTSFAVFVGALLTLSIGSQLLARPVDLWSEERLWKEADLVVIGTATSTEDGNADATNAKPESWVEVDTTFAASRVLQGPPAAESVVVRHRRYRSTLAETAVVDGPSFVEFDPAKKHSYLMFLKKTETDGVYEPLTGQYDPWQSFVQQVRYHVTNERSSDATAAGN